MAETAKKPILKEEADKLFASTSHNVLWANPSGEFFTSENLGNLSLKPKQVLTKFERPAKGAKAATEDQTK